MSALPTNFLTSGIRAIGCIFGVGIVYVNGTIHVYGTVHVYGFVHVYGTIHVKRWKRSNNFGVQSRE